MWIYGLFTIVGGLIVLHELAKIVKYGYIRFVKAPKHPLTYGKWSIITGATDGIGKAIAFELAAKGCNLLLISRTSSKLEAVKKEISSKYGGITISTLAVDYSTFSSGSQSFKDVKSAVDKIGSELGLLVNNVGASYSHPMYFHELTEDDCQQLIDLNITSTVLMTKICLPHFLKRSSGCVVNIGSFAGVLPSPLLAEYSSAKQFIDTFTRSLAVEYKQNNIDFQCHVPLYIVSKLSKIRKPSMMVPSAEEYAASVVNSLGKGEIVSGHFGHSVVTELAKTAPRSILLNKVKNMHLAIRKKALEKKSKQQ